MRVLLLGDLLVAASRAGFLPRWLDDAPLQDALTEGCRLGALAVSRVGAGPD